MIRDRIYSYLPVPRTNRLAFFSVFLSLLVTLAIVEVDFCTESENAQLRQIILTDRLTENSIGPPTSVFASTTTTLYAAYVVESEREASITGVWIAAAVGPERDFEIRRATAALQQGMTSGVLRLTNPDGFPAGLYELRILINDSLVHTVPFRVVAPAGGAPPSGTSPTATTTPTPAP